jgi:hypothetical protein
MAKHTNACQCHQHTNSQQSRLRQQILLHVPLRDKEDSRRDKEDSRCQREEHDHLANDLVPTVIVPTVRSDLTSRWERPLGNITCPKNVAISKDSTIRPVWCPGLLYLSGGSQVPVTLEIHRLILPSIGT